VIFVQGFNPLDEKQMLLVADRGSAVPLVKIAVKKAGQKSWMKAWMC